MNWGVGETLIIDSLIDERDLELCRCHIALPGSVLRA